MVDRNLFEEIKEGLEAVRDNAGKEEEKCDIARFSVVIEFNNGQEAVVLNNIVDLIAGDIMLTAFVDEDYERWTESYPTRTIYKVRRYD